ncbi:hypothetical protein AYO38_04700 [bacterium SCGC AG-212-C10]|nr:hypothetical protein AYO38_04700 [bacterium SCGC AG-212-C10]
MGAADDYRQMVERANGQRAALERIDGDRWSRHAPGYRFDPLRSPGPNFEALAAYVRPEDDVIEVGGGAGRIALPLARRCRFVTNVEPSDGMRAEFDSLATAAGITNVAQVGDDWLAAPVLNAGVALTVDVTYFVPDIEPFVRKLVASARRRVIISIWDTPPPNWNARLFALAHGRPPALVPGEQELLPVLTELGIRPVIVRLPEVFSWPEAQPLSRVDAIDFALGVVHASTVDGARERISSHFDELFAESGGVFRPLWRPSSPGLLLTWETT